MSRPLLFPTLSAPQVWVPRKIILPDDLFSRNRERPFQEMIGRGDGNRPDSFFESAEPDVVGHTARRSGALEPVVHVKRLPGHFVQYRRHGGREG